MFRFAPPYAYSHSRSRHSPCRRPYPFRRSDDVIGLPLSTVIIIFSCRLMTIFNDCRLNPSLLDVLVSRKMSS